MWGPELPAWDRLLFPPALGAHGNCCVMLKFGLSTESLINTKSTSSLSDTEKVPRITTPQLNRIVRVYFQKFIKWLSWLISTGLLKRNQRNFSTEHHINWKINTWSFIHTRPKWCCPTWLFSWDRIYYYVGGLCKFTCCALSWQIFRERSTIWPHALCP